MKNYRDFKSLHQYQYQYNLKSDKGFAYYSIQLKTFNIHLRSKYL
jgi:hypothetical protein